MIDLGEKVAIITGAAGGFGQVLVRAFLDAGARVAAMDVDEGRLRELSSALGSAGADRFLSLSGDIADYAECERAIARTHAELGGVGDPQQRGELPSRRAGRVAPWLAHLRRGRSPGDGRA